MSNGQFNQIVVVSGHPVKAFELLNEMRKNKRFVDIELVTKTLEVPIYAHRVVLAACSTYFDRMFQKGFQEENIDRVELRSFEDSPNALELLINYMYTSKIIINEENVQDILAGANMLDLGHIKNAAVDILIRMIDPTNCVAMRSLGIAYNCPDLHALAQNCLLDNFELVCYNADFLELTQTEVQFIISHDDLIVRREETIWEVIVAWTDYDATRRDTAFSNLFHLVRLDVLPPDFVRDKIRNHPYVQIHESLLLLIDKRLTYNTVGSRVRGSNKLVFLQCANNSSWIKTQPVLFDLKQLTWSTLNGPLLPLHYREGTCFVQWGENILSIGGEYNNSSVSDELVLDANVYSLSLDDPCNNKWKIHSRLLCRRKRHQSVVCNDTLFILGGYDANCRPLDTVEILRKGSLDWIEGPKMISRRVSHGAVSLLGTVWVVGGWNGSRIVETMERLNLETNCWEEIKTNNPTSMAGMKMGIACSDNKLYVVGGCLQTLQPCYSAHVFEPLIGEWTRLPDMKYSRSGPVLVPYRGQLFVFGGEGNSGGVVEKYDPFNRKWEILFDNNVKHYMNFVFSGALVDKPWDWDLPSKVRQRLPTPSAGPDSSQQERVLSDIDLDAVRTIRSHYY